MDSLLNQNRGRVVYLFPTIILRSSCVILSCARPLGGLSCSTQFVYSVRSIFYWLKFFSLKNMYTIGHILIDLISFFLDFTQIRQEEVIFRKGLKRE
jgi:hypothetical protein